MKITLDVSPAINGKAGLGRYAASLASALHRAHPGDISLFANLTPTARTIPEFAGIPMATVTAGYKPWRMSVWGAQAIRLPFNRLIGPAPDLFHATEHLLLPLAGIPTVLTIHDLIFEVFPQHHTRLNYTYLHHALPMYARRAAGIITVSETSKRDIIRLYGIPAEKIRVIYEAASGRFGPASADEIARVRKNFTLPERYIATLGTIEPRKNLPRLVEALGALRGEFPDLALVVIGSKGWLYDDFFAAIEAHGQGDAVILPGYVPDGDLPAMLAGAAAVVQPSLYEGFGLPVLEAMACGAPVACSRTSSLGEIAGDAALTFDPEDVGEIARAVRRLLTDRALADDLRGRGFAHEKTFSWDRAASETYDYYQSILDSGK